MQIIKNEDAISGWTILGKVTTEAQADEIKKFVEVNGFVDYCKKSELGKIVVNGFYESYKKQYFWNLKGYAELLMMHCDKEDYNYGSIEKIREAKKAMSPAERKAKSRENAKKEGGQILGGIVLTSKAADQLSALCFHTGLNKTQVINKLLEEQEQLKLL